MSAILPAAFADSLTLRAKNLRFRGVGNPYAFLDGIGIIPIKEFLFRGANIIELAEALNLPLTTIHIWIAENNHQPEIEEASTISAEGYIWRGESLLNAATNKFELDKAKTMLEHGRFMAAKKNKKVYGNTQDVATGQAAVNYTFNIGNQPAVTLIGNTNNMPIDAEFKEVISEVKFNITEEFNLGLPPEYLNTIPDINIKPVPQREEDKDTKPEKEQYGVQDRW